MKVLVLSLMAIFTLQTVSAQTTTSIQDPNYVGVKVYSSTGYSGAATACTDLNATYQFPGGIGSVKVYGPWKLVNTSSNLSISEDDSHYNGSGSGTWKLEQTSEKYFGIIYSDPNYRGQATYVKLNKTENFFETGKSMKLKRPANVGWSDASGYQRTFKAGNYAKLRKDLARIDLHMKYSRVGDGQ